MSKLHREYFAYQASQIADEWAKKYVTPAFRGDPEAASDLAIALGNANRGAVAVAMWQGQVAPAAFRAFLSPVWDHDHHHLFAAARTRRRLASMFRYAAFSLPANIPATVQLWRGTSGFPLEDATRGYSWTTNRATACWFAMRHERFFGAPLVLRATVKKSRIVYASNERGEHEAVLMRPPAGASIDGSPSDWLAECEEVERLNRASTRAFLAAYDNRVSDSARAFIEIKDTK
jgi:hypothetical protein